MSADTGIYIAKFPDGYRVTQVVQCIDNIVFFAPNTKGRKEELASFFGNSKIYQTLGLAREKAWEIYDQYNKDEEDFGMGCPIEYGVSYIGEYENFDENVKDHIER